MQHMLGGLIIGDVTVQRTTQETAQGKVARRGFECISDAARTRGDVARMELWRNPSMVYHPVVHCQWTRHLMKLM